jgi:hypothetical protein
MSKIVSSLLLGAALITMPAGAATRRDPGAELQKLLAGRVPEAPVSCIDPGLASSSTVIEGQAIVYRVGSRLFVNTTEDPSRLRDDDILVTNIRGSQLCNHDSVQLLARTSQVPRGFVLLGKFVPYSKPAKAR